VSPDKTNAARALDALGIAYELRAYEVDEDDLSAETVAAKVGLPPEQVYKTLLARGDPGGLVYAVLSASEELDGKAMARATGDKRVELVALKEVQPLTGFLRGGVTAIGGKKVLPVVVDEAMELFDVVCVSAGVRGLQIVMAPGDYVRATGARGAGIGRGKR
jgi:Cys-tRNA(Pro)/Cys-tRNA(Cys) deacylase